MRIPAAIVRIPAEGLTVSALQPLGGLRSIPKSVAVDTSIRNKNPTDSKSGSDLMHHLRVKLGHPPKKRRLADRNPEL